MTIIDTDAPTTEAPETVDNGDKAPKRRGRPKNSAPAGAMTAKDAARIRATLEALFGGLKIAALGGAQFAPKSANALMADALALDTYAPGIIDALIALCAEDKHVRAFFLTLSTGGAYTAVVMAVAPLVWQILLNHDMVPLILRSAPNPTMNGTATASVAN